MMNSIVDYQKSKKALLFASQKVVHRGWSFMRRSTVGWYLCVQWRDGSMLWQALNDLNESNQVETAKYEATQEIYHEPVFNWWVNSVLTKR